MRNVRIRSDTFPLAAPFVIARGSKTAAEVVAVELREGGAVGRGEGVPYARYGESVASVEAQLRAVEAALGAGIARDELAALLPPGAARNAADCALWDLEAKLSGIGVDERIGLAAPSSTATALTVGIDTPERMAQAAAALLGADLIKVKVDADAPDLALTAVRAAAPKARLIVDPNESWTFDLLERMQPLLLALRIEFVEQPLPAGEDEMLDGFAPRVPICADESCHVAGDLERLAGRYGLVNIKLDKTGGLTEALVLLDCARRRGFGVMVGCMICTSLSIAPALRIAAAADYADLDGPLWLKQDRNGGIGLDAGRIIPPPPGFWG
ncbi:MAG: dipeptide epimerase [Alphaproteobacteria bacterium]|nr:dipeptide epimerase [Alphaproteobacteria bacterium]MDB5719871.1 dipeptide epimerase [Alphaproteobacteria bacterium]